MMIEEGIIFFMINVGVSLLLRAGQEIWPSGPFRSLLFFLFIVGLILSLNLYRTFVMPKMRLLYAVISILNVLTTVGIGNSGFLTSLISIYLIVSSII
jgi:hypothetical protein